MHGNPHGSIEMTPNEQLCGSGWFWCPAAFRSSASELSPPVTCHPVHHICNLCPRTLRLRFKRFPERRLQGPKSCVVPRCCMKPISRFWAPICVSTTSVCSGLGNGLWRCPCISRMCGNRCRSQLSHALLVLCLQFLFLAGRHRTFNRLDPSLVALAL